MSFLRPTIAQKIGSLLVLQTLGGILALAAFFRFLFQSAPYQDWIAVAEHQRQHARLLHAFADRAGIDQGDRVYLPYALEVFDQAQAALERGGKFLTRTLKPPPPQALPAIREVKRRLAELRPRLEAIAARSSGDAEADQLHRALHPDVPEFQRACEQVVAVFQQEAALLRGRMLRTLVWICALDLALLLLGLWVTFRHIVRPIRRVEAAARRLRSGDFGSRVDLVARDEIGALSQAFNDMASDLARLVAAVEAARRRSENLLAGVPVGLLVVSPDLVILSSNAHLPEVVAPGSAVLAGRPLQEIVPAPGLPERARAVLETGAPVSNLLWEASTASPPAPLNLTISRMEASEPGEGRSLLITLKDLTELERLRAASQACERRYYGLLQDVEAIVWEAQSDPFGFLFVSQKAQTLLGYPVERWLTERDFLGAHLHPEDRAVRSLLTDAIPDDRAQEFDCRLLGAGRRVVWLHVTFRALPDSSGRSRARLRGIMVDVTALKLAEHQQARYNLELEQLAHAAAHHLQEPVRTVASFAQLLVRRYHSRLDSQADQFLELLAGGAARMQRLIADLLSYLQVAQQPLDLGPIDAETVFHDAVQALHQTLEASAATVGHDPLPSLHADPRQLQKLFESLLDNAVKFRGPEPPRVHVSVEDTPAEWLFRVRDNGIGIDPLYHDRIFGIFQRLHGREQYPGTGIGLALCRRILERHYGRLWVESEPGQGAAFCFTVPRHPA